MTPELNRIYVGDSLDVMRTWPDGFVQTVVTSPPYWGLRDYGVVGQSGLEKSPSLYIAKMVEIFREVYRVLRDDGTLWINLGDSYNNDRTGGHGATGGADKSTLESPGPRSAAPTRKSTDPLLKPKDLVGIPWRMAFALQADGWYLRSDIIWAKPNPMPESVTDRPTKAHEYIFLLTKREQYYYDADAIKEPAQYFGATGVDASGSKDAGNYDGKNSYKVPSVWMTGKGAHTSKRGYFTDQRKPLPDTQENLGKFRDKRRGHSRRHAGFNSRWDDMEKSEQCGGMRNKRSVWTVGTSPFPEAHFVTYPPALIKPCILAGSAGGDIVLDPFMGAGTTALVAAELGRNYLGVELNPTYAAMAERRIANEKAQVKMAI